MYSYCTPFASPKQNNSLLWKLILSPDSCSNMVSNSFMYLASSKLCSIKMIVSSAYCRMDMPPSTRCGIRSEIYPSCFALSIKIANISATKLKSKGDNGSPYLKPFFVWKYLPTSSLNLIATLPFVTKASIQEHHSSGKPFIRRVCWRKFHLTLSYAFSKSSFKITPLSFFIGVRVVFHEGPPLPQECVFLAWNQIELGELFYLPHSSICWQLPLWRF